MHVSVKNFDQVFPAFRSSLQGCDFFSLDLEMTGIDPMDEKIAVKNPDSPFYVDPQTWMSPARAARASDNAIALLLRLPEERYQTKLTSAQKYSIMQIGVSTFHSTTRDDVMFSVKSPTQLFQEFFLIDIRGEKKTASPSTSQPRQASVSPNAQNSSSSSGAMSPALKELFELCQNCEMMSSLREATRIIREHEISILKQGGAADPIGPERDMFIRFLTELRGIIGPYIQSKVIPSLYRCKTFTFFMFPSTEFDLKEFICDPTTLGDFFGRKNTMDFNVWIREGLRYCSAKSAMLERIQRLQNSSPSSAQDIVNRSRETVPPQDLDKISNVLAQMESGKPEIDSPYLANNDSFAAVRTGASLFGYIKDGKKWKKATNNNNSEALCAPNPAVEAMRDFEGTIVLEEIFHAAKHRRVVLHNCWSDLLFLYVALKEKERSIDSYSDFKRALRAEFPDLIDTRTLSSLEVLSHIPNNRASLATIFDAAMALHLNKSFAVGSDLMFDPTKGSGAHDAGYDAYQTGCLYIALRTELANRCPRVSLKERLNGVLSVHGCPFFINLREEFDFYVAPTNLNSQFPSIILQVVGISDLNRVKYVLEQREVSCAVMRTGDTAMLLFINLGACRNLVPLISAKMTHNEFLLLETSIAEDTQRVLRAENGFQNALVQRLPLTERVQGSASKLKPFKLL